MITPTGTVSHFASVPHCSALAFDSAGNLYTGQSGFTEGSIFKIDPGGNVTLFAIVVDGIHGLAFDVLGNLFVGGRFSHTIYKITPDGTVTIFASGLGNTIFDGPNGLAFFEPIPMRRPRPTPHPH